jgi:hypothetical protein
MQIELSKHLQRFLAGLPLAIFPILIYELFLQILQLTGTFLTPNRCRNFPFSGGRTLVAADRAKNPKISFFTS